MASLKFFIDIILSVALWWTQPLNRNQYQEYFLGGKGGRCVGLTILPPSCADFGILGASTSWNPKGLSSSVMGVLYINRTGGFSPSVIIPSLLHIHSSTIRELDNEPIRGRRSTDSLNPPQEYRQSSDRWTVCCSYKSHTPPPPFPAKE
jgi:hypothetical protein